MKVYLYTIIKRDDFELLRDILRMIKGLRFNVRKVKKSYN